MRDFVVDICYGPLDQKEKPSSETSHSQAHVFMVGLQHISICWRDSTGEHKEFRRILECINGNFKTGG